MKKLYEIIFSFSMSLFKFFRQYLRNWIVYKNKIYFILKARNSLKCKFQCQYLRLETEDSATVLPWENINSGFSYKYRRRRFFNFHWIVTFFNLDNWWRNLSKIDFLISINEFGNCKYVKIDDDSFKIEKVTIQWKLNEIG